MGSLSEMKERYENIAIPEELTVRVQQEITKSRNKQMEKKKHRYWFQKVVRGIGTAAAAVGIVFTLTLNTMPAFAMEAAQLPVIGRLARVLTFRSYEEKKDDIAISVEIPSIEMIERDTAIQVVAINQEILHRCNQYAEEAITRAKEYRTAFLETGGTLEEWAAHNIKIKIDYEIKQQDDTYLSFVIRGYENWSNAYNESRYYNLDLRTGKEVTLKDLLGDDYEALVNESIRQQIMEREQAIVQETTQEAQQAALIEEIPEEPETETAETMIQSAEKYEDNFSVDSQAAKEFAEKVKAVTSKRDLEGLAELTSFPVYVGLPGVGGVENKEDFLKLGSDAVFTEELMKSVETADIDNLQPSRAGFSISAGGTSNINFGVVNGVLAINGINY